MGVTDAPLVEIEAEIRTIAASMSRHEVRLLQLVGAFDAANGWMAAGCVTCAHWLANLLDIEVCTAREKVRVARALQRLPVLREQFVEGGLSYAKVRHVSRIATRENERDLIALARDHQAGQLPRVLAAWQRSNDPDAFEERRRADRGVTFRDEPTGNRTAIARLSPDVVATLELLVDEEAGNGPREASEPRRTLRQVRADAFTRLIDRLASADASADASSRQPRRELVLHRRVGETSLGDGTVLPRAVARYFTCEADLRVMVHFPDGSPADLGRRSRLVSRRLRRVVLERDAYRCRYPECDVREYLDVHHVVHWEDGGRTDAANLITYCGFHHRFVHEHGPPAAGG